MVRLRGALKALIRAGNIQREYIRPNWEQIEEQTRNRILRKRGKQGPTAAT
jgi:hypothetical protein